MNIYEHVIDNCIFAKFSRVALKDIFATLEIRDLCMIYVYK